MKQSEGLFSDLDFLSHRFPFLFSKGLNATDLDRQDDGVPYLCSLETQEGWHQLIYDTCEEIRNILLEYDLLHKYNIAQIKTKYGELRIYGYFDLDTEHQEASKKLDALIDAATEKSKTICEFCGEPGVCNNHKGLIATMCPQCIEKLDEITGR